MIVPLVGWLVVASVRELSGCLADVGAIVTRAFLERLVWASGEFAAGPVLSDLVDEKKVFKQPTDVSQVQVVRDEVMRPVLGDPVNPASTLVEVEAVVALPS